jgi:hypothetical protein
VIVDVRFLGVPLFLVAPFVVVAVRQNVVVVLMRVPVGVMLPLDDGYAHMVMRNVVVVIVWTWAS